jgi:predicted XRE-type DNA-binding protein
MRNLHGLVLRAPTSVTFRLRQEKSVAMSLPWCKVVKCQTIGSHLKKFARVPKKSGCAPPRFQAESDARVAARQAMKAEMMAQVDAWIKREKITQSQAAQIRQVSRPRVTDIVNRKVEKFSIDTLIDLLGRVGMRVQFTVI